MSDPKRLAKRYCGVFNCLNNTIHNPELSYFTLPKNKERAALWLKIIHREISSNTHISVCESHFNKYLITRNEKRNRLSADAIPTLNLPDDEFSIRTVSQCSQTEPEIPPPSRSTTTQTEEPTRFSVEIQTSLKVTENTTRKTKLKKKLKRLKRDVKCKKLSNNFQQNVESNTHADEMRTLFSLCDKYLSVSLANLVKIHTSLKEN